VEKYPTIGVGLSLAGLVLTAGYFVYQMKGKKSLMLELLLAAIASIALGFGTLFLMLSFSLYV
jgi:hypothetical protein